MDTQTQTQAQTARTPREQMNVVIVGHVDHGKSTLVGRLLADTGTLPTGKLDAVRRLCERTSKPFEYAFLLDALEDEQDQGITIDTARVFFKTDKREYILIDAPGHIEFLKNMISGAARAEAAILLIDAREGVKENSRRHGYVLRMLGVRHVVVAVNKMDLVGFDQKVFDAIEEEYRGFLAGIGAVSPRRFVPVCSRDGDNIAERSERMGWYDGPTILGELDGFPKEPPKADQPLRFPLQDVYKFTAGGDDRRIVAGRIEAGRVRVGDRVVFSPSGKTTTIRTIEGFNVEARASLEAGWSVGFTLAEELYITRGEVMSHLERRPSVGRRFRANLIWLGREPLSPGRLYKLKLHTTATPVRVHKLLKVLDASKLDGELEKDVVGRHDVADLILETTEPVAFDLSSDLEITGRFVLVDGYEIAGGGVITERVADEEAVERAEDRLKNPHWLSSGVSARERAERVGHGAGLILLVGREGVGLHSLAQALEQHLFGQGRAAYLLDGTNPLRDAPMDDSFEVASAELARRFSEVARHLLEAGFLVVATGNAFGLGDHGRVLQRLDGFASVTVEVSQDGRGSLPTDLKASAAEPLASLGARLLERLSQQS